MKKALGLLFLLSSCSAAPVGLSNHHVVDAGKLERFAQPDAVGYELLAKAGIRTVVKLNSEMQKEEEGWAKERGIRLISIPLPGIAAPTEADESRIQAILNDAQYQPVGVHCEWGKDRTGLAVALYRVHVQGWAAKAAKDEWYALGHKLGFLGMDEFLSDHAK